MTGRQRVAYGAKCVAYLPVQAGWVLLLLVSWLFGNADLLSGPPRPKRPVDGQR